MAYSVSWLSASWLRAVALAGLAALGAAPAQAADYLNFPVESAPAFVLKPVELGSGWYLRGGLGASNNKGPQLIPEAPVGRKPNWALDVGAGYKLNNWLRTDATLTFNKPQDVTRAGAPVTYAEINKVDMMLNAYVDLGSWSGFTPFVGVGGGVSLLKAQTSFGDLKASKKSYNLAWSLMGGVAYDITPQLKTEFSYRYLNSGSFTSLSSPLVGSVKSKIDSHQMQIGFRYMLD